MELSSDALSRYAVAFGVEDLPAATVEKTKRVVIDTLGCAIGAYASPPSKVLRECYGHRPAGADGATVIGSGERVPVEYAALVNAAMGRYLDFNDTYVTEGRACHPSDHVPALLSVAEAEGKSGADLIEAIALAYEIQGAGIDAGGLFERGFDYSTWGILSSTLSVGSLMDLSAPQLVDALGIAGSSSLTLGVSRMGEVSMWKGVAHPYVSHNAIQACQLARAGLTGPEALFEGEMGFFQAVTDGPVEFGALGGRDADGYRIDRTNLKPFACGYYMQTGVTAALELRREHDLDPEDIESVRIRTFGRAKEVLAGEEKWGEALTRETADHSMPYTIAVALVSGAVTPRQYRSASLTDDRVHDLMGAVSVVEDEALTQYARDHPESIPAIVEIDARGTVVEARADVPLGHASAPMTEAQLEEKLRSLAEPYLTDQQVERLRSLTDTLDEVERLQPLLSTLTV